jgi:uncharacterized protein YndB with AHSA1/START domain
MCPHTDMTRTDPILSTVGHDNGRLVLHFECLLSHPPDELWRVLTASEHREHWIPCGILDELRKGTTVQPPFWPVHLEPGENGVSVLTGVTRVWQAPAVFEWTSDADTVRWEVSTTDAGTRLEFTTWIDSDDVEVAASAGAGYHACFEQLVRLLETGSIAPPFQCAHFAALETQYNSAVAAALADTD